MMQTSRAPIPVTDRSESPVSPVTDERSARIGNGLLWVALIVFAAQLAFALWMNARGFLWGDAVSRATSALVALYSNDPHLAAIGFVWMPLPTMFELIPASFYPLWPGIVSSGFASSIVTVFAGTLTAVIVYATARRLTLSGAVSAACSLVVAFSPMIFLFSTNGMSEGVASPFMIGSVCCLLLFWEGGQRRYVAASAVMLALAFACLYQAVHFGAGLFVALIFGIFASENVRSAPQGRLRAIEGLAILFLVPSAYVGLLWVIANAAIMGDPLYFATSIYSNEGYIAASGMERLSNAVEGSISGSLGFAAIRTLPFILPVFSILVVRSISGRLFRINTLTLTVVALIVPFGLIVPQLYGGQSFGWLRYFVYPLYVAAGWGVYEIAKSRYRRVATLLILTGWLLVIPASLWQMSDPRYGQNENAIIAGIATSEDADRLNYPLYFQNVEPVAAALDRLDSDQLVLADSSNAWPIEATVTPETLKENIVPTSDERFFDALRAPRENGVEYLLVPNPATAQQDLIANEYPRLWAGNAPGFILERDFTETGLEWKLYRVDQKSDG